MKSFTLAVLFVACARLFTSCADAPARQDAAPNQILFLGVAHIQTLQDQLGYDVRRPEEQAALESVCAAVAGFRPDRIYLEVQRQYQAGLETQYSRYLEGNLQGAPADFEQLGFRCGAASGLTTVHALDVRPRAFDHEAMLAELSPEERQHKARRDSLEQQKMMNTIGQLLETGTITDLIYHLNAPAKVADDMAGVLSLLQYGEPGDTTALQTVSEWYARHLDMWAFIQRSARRDSGNRVVVIMGASHTSLLRQLAGTGPGWEIVELEDLMTR
ncbi:DUF5694 domain-containing protein [Lewinella sp. IMCC34183]|uniref:DUF5694 domain-containing protein n=1 Tax=Lewinella sp. IMCC34183 TaxID=2248762 RepID=UPI000E224C5E|nr:DUF5694 domain-containing protein [Lewinella sp. IMCC34183]